jgi:hypothetical protein
MNTKTVGILVVAVSAMLAAALVAPFHLTDDAFATSDNRGRAGDGGAGGDTGGDTGFEICRNPRIC